MFNKLVAIEPVSLIPSAEAKLKDYAKEVVLYGDIPADDEEILRRIGDADAVLLSYTSRITRSVIERCQNVRYIGMCCSLYSEESANVDIACAREHGIRVLGKGELTKKLTVVAAGITEGAKAKIEAAGGKAEVK